MWARTPELTIIICSLPAFTWCERDEQSIAAVTFYVVFLRRSDALRKRKMHKIPKHQLPSGLVKSRAPAHACLIADRQSKPNFLHLATSRRALKSTTCSSGIFWRYRRPLATTEQSYTGFNSCHEKKGDLPPRSNFHCYRIAPARRPHWKRYNKK